MSLRALAPSNSLKVRGAAVRCALAGASAALLLWSLACPWPVTAQALSVAGAPPSFTAAQAARGKLAYAASNCGMCHGEDLAGSGSGPALTGPTFAELMKGQSVDQLFAFMSSQMPPFAAGSLDRQTYADIAAYIFQSNAVAAGQQEFQPADVAAKVAETGRVPVLRTAANHDAVYQAAISDRKAELNRITPVTDQMLRDPSAGDWLIWRRTYNSQGYSPLNQIDRKNVKNLALKWSWSLPPSGNETTPLVHDGVLFIKSANQVQALDGATGAQLWRYVRTYPAWLHNGETEIVKNLAIYQNMLYVPTLDGHLLALDVKTGNILWDHVIVGPKEEASRLAGPRDSPDAQHYLMVADGGPLVANGEVIVGLAGCSNDYKGGCFILGLNAKTGQQDWRFDTIARPGQPGGDSWNGAPVDERFGGSVWISGSYDPDLNLVYFGIGQTYKNSTLLDPQASKGQSNDALYTDSTVALEPGTGKLAWYYQHFRADVWDLDWAFEQTLVNLPVDGTSRKLVVTGGKIGIFDALDRSTGKYAFSRNLGLQNIVTSIDPKSGEKTIDPAFMPSPSAPRGRGVCPYARDEPSTAYDPATQTLYVPVMNDSCPDPEKKFDGQFGRLEAINLPTGKIVWMDRHRAPEISSVLATGGGLVFDGSMDREFRASDAANGAILWRTGLANAPKSSPITYSAAGKQYVAVVTGGERENNTAAGTTPEISDAAPATTLWVFALPSESGAPTPAQPAR